MSNPITQKKSKNVWGRPAPDDLPEGTPVFGARAIFKRNGAKDARGVMIDILHDRMDWTGESERCKAMSKKLDKMIWTDLKQEIVERGVYPDGGEVLRLEKDGIVLEASPNQSYGYLYIVAWEVE